MVTVEGIKVRIDFYDVRILISLFEPKSIALLCEELPLNEWTVRKRVEALEKQGLVKRFKVFPLVFQVSDVELVKRIVKTFLFRLRKEIDSIESALSAKS